MTGLAPHLQNMWLPCVRVLSSLYFNRLIKRGKWYAVRKFIIFDESSEWLSRTIPTRLVVIMPELFFGYYVVVSVFLCSFILFFHLKVCRLFLAQYILFVIGNIGQLCHAMETKYSPMSAIERTRLCDVSDHRANAVIFALGKKSTFINF